jgi:Flp pilus assembly protein TadG
MFSNQRSARPISSKARRGWVLMCGALVATVLFGFLGLAFDTGVVQMQRLRAQMAADNAAVAGALEVRNNTGNQVLAAKAAAKLNGFEHGVNGDTVSVSSIDANNLRVDVTRTVSTTFMNVLGVSSSMVTARAGARLATDTTSAGGSGCVFVMQTTGSRTAMLGGSSLIRTDCGIFVNSTNNGAMSNDGQGCWQVTSGGINIVGGYEYIWGSGAPAPPNPLPAANATNCPNGIVNNQAPPKPSGGYNGGANFADPGASLVAPTVGSCNYTNTQINMSNYTNFQPGGQLHPGTYCGGITISGQVGTITMQAGTYIMAGGGFQINGGGSVQGSGVFIYNTVASGYSYQPFVFTSQGSNANLTAPTTGTYAGVLLFTDRAMTSTNLNQINGNSQTKLQGTIYMPSVPLIISGSGSSVNQDAAYTAIVAKTLTVNGGGQLRVKADYSSLPNGKLPIGTGNSPKLLYLGE